MADAPLDDRPNPPGSSGDDPTTSAWFARLYQELHALARSYLRRERTWHTLQATALVHEAWLHLARGGERAFADRTHFVAVAARTIRRVLVNHAEARGAKKRGGGNRGLLLALDDVADAAADQANGRALDLLALDEAMTRFEALDPRAARAVELRYFGGLGVDEIATALSVSARTVDSDLAMARAWLLAELGPADDA